MTFIHDGEILQYVIRCHVKTILVKHTRKNSDDELEECAEELAHWISTLIYGV